MKKYLLDTNICIYHIKGLHDIDRKIIEVGINNCFLSEITIAEMKYGIENSEHKEKNREEIEQFVELFQIIPIASCFDIYAREKVRLKKQGKPIDDFDLMIGCSAIANGLVLVTRNLKHFERLSSIELENWVDEQAE